MAGADRPCPPYIVDPTKLKYLAVTVMTAASTVLAKSVRFLEHVSPGCCAGIANIARRYPGPCESVHIKLLVSPVSFSHNNVRLVMAYRPYAKFAYRVTCRFRDYACKESDGQTDSQTDRITTVTLAAHAREGK